MKHTLLTFLCVAMMSLGLSSANAQQDATVTSDSNSVRVLTFNIRMAYGEIGKPHEWKNRRPGVLEVMKAGNYDFIGVQEAIIDPDKEELNQAGHLQTSLTNYGVVTRSRMESELKGESTPLFYNKDRWKLDEKEHGVFWLSKTPNVPGSIDTGAACPRTVCWGRFLQIKDGTPTGKAVYFYNTHYDHIGDMARCNAAFQLCNFIAKRQHLEDPAIVTGDLNCYKDSIAMRFMAGEKIKSTDPNKKLEIQSPVALKDVYEVVHPGSNEGSFNNFKAAGHGRIDYIWTTSDLKPQSAKIITDKKNGLFLSDHFPIESVLTFEK